MVILKELSEASSSYSSPSNDHHQMYDVFLSFRGVDTRLSFSNHLHKALEGANLKTFLDDKEIETGLHLKPELEIAIKTSRASVIVLSKNYASSTWCLDELVLILDQHTTCDHIVIPIFYHVEPTDVRKQQNSFGEAMTKHKQRMEAEANLEKKSQWADKIEIWKKALTQVADLKGQEAKGRLETELVDEIVKDIYHQIRVPIRSTLPQLIGMDDSIEFVTSWLKDRSTHTVDILTLYGMGGIGKTSLAKYVYGSHYREFKGSSFLESISRKSREHFNGLIDLQKQICADILKTSMIQVHDVSIYTSTIENAVTSKKVFLVLDDIDSLEQLDALLGNRGFHPGSKIIITTKDVSLTERCALFNPQFQPKHTKHLLHGLHDDASLKLLCLHGFKGDYPKEGYEEVSENLVKYCEGHPLALEVLGRSLFNRDVTFWEECIKGLKKEPHSRIKMVLQMSFDSLPSKNEKRLFKYIACYFVGKDRDFTETVLKACDDVINVISGITILIERCLLRWGWNNDLVMHSLIQEIGKDAVCQESPEKPWKRSLLWCHEDSFEVLKQKKGTGKIKGLTLDMRMLEKEKFPNTSSNMDNLMILHLDYVQVNGSYENFPENIRWLRMHGFPLKSIPSDLPMMNLVALDMSYSNIKSFGMSCSNQKRSGKRQKLTGSSSKETRLLGSLKILDVSFCKRLRSLGGFFGLPALERLIVTNCIGLIEICESIKQCVELVLIDLSYCIKLEELPRSLGKLKKVKILLLDGCKSGESQIEMRDMDSPEILQVNKNGINFQTCSSSIVMAISRDLKSLAVSFPSSLVMLSVANNNLCCESFPIDLSCLSMLTYLSLDGNPIVAMPNCVRSLPRLEALSMHDCKMLTSIEHPPRTLTGARFDGPLLRKIVFDPEMSPLNLYVEFVLAPSSMDIEGVVKIQPMVGVDESVLHSLEWSNLEFTKERHVIAYNYDGEPEESQTQMYYEFGIFSTIYRGKKMPKWIKRRSKGTSISFNIPLSPKKLRGLNFCYVQTSSRLGTPDQLVFLLPDIIVNNKTKNLTWIYKHYIDKVDVGGKRLTFLSHWMFGVNDMEAGDHVTITSVTEDPYQLTKKCGVRLVYEDEIMEEEDVLGKYKSWNHIIGGDLSPFQLTTGEYFLDIRDMWRSDNEIYSVYHPYIANDARYKEKQRVFHRFLPKKLQHNGLNN